MGKINAPELLIAQHSTVEFDCSEPTLNQWLQRNALKNQMTGASRTFVVTDSQKRIVGYYALATGGIQRRVASGGIRRNMPDPIPVLVLGRLAVDRRLQGLGVGSGLLKDAVLRSLQVADQVGTRALLVHALSESAKDFYCHWGFIPSELQPDTLMLPLW